MAVGWAKEGDGDLESENEIAEGIHNVREQLKRSEGVEKQTHCIDCGAQIPKQRLAIFPFAQRCVQCQSDYE